MNNILRGQSVHWIGAHFCVFMFQKQVFKHVKVLSEPSKKIKEQKKNKGSVLVAESADNAQNAHFIQFHTYRKLYENSMISNFP